MSIVKQVILDDQVTTLKTLSEKWIVSKTSILNDINIINQIIETSSGSIQSTNSNIKFVGSEEQRQVALSTFMVTNIDKNRTINDELLSEFFSTRVVNAVDLAFKIIKRKWLSDMPSYYSLAIRIIIMVLV
ncbi:transcriptional antiterminator, partial [Lactobacillus sp. XV13L]|nr:transcriptional antiterminator [Lactobacillus sp. XV13L]